MYIVKMWNMLEMYKDDYWIVEYSVMEDKKAWYGWHIKALKRWDNRSFKEALIFWDSRSKKHLNLLKEPVQQYTLS